VRKTGFALYELYYVSVLPFDNSVINAGHTVSQVKEVFPVDPEHPRMLYIFLDDLPKARTGVIEFDTEESAADWRRELQGNIFVWYRCLMFIHSSIQ